MKTDGLKVLVIGGGGFIGSHLVEELLKTDIKEVIVYDNFSRGSKNNLKTVLKDARASIFPLGGDILHTDILDKAMEGVDVVFHFAALWLLHCHEYPQSAFDVNIKGTFNILEACRKHHIKKLIYSSSASVYGDAVEEPMSENHVFNNKTFYGATKIAGEQMLRSYYYRYGLKSIGLRYMNVYGPRQDYKGTYTAVMMKILDNLDKGMPPQIYGDGSQAYDFIYVADVAKANVCALKSDCDHGFFNVGCGEKTSINELTKLLLKLSGKEDISIEYCDGGETFVTNRIGTTQLAKEQINFEWNIDLKDGLNELIKWRNAQLIKEEKN